MAAHHFELPGTFIDIGDEFGNMHIAFQSRHGLHFWWCIGVAFVVREIFTQQLYKRGAARFHDMNEKEFFVVCG